MRAKRLNRRLLRTVLALLLALGVSVAPYRLIPSTPAHAAQNASTQVTIQARVTTQVGTQPAHVHHAAHAQRLEAQTPETPVRRPHHDPRHSPHCVLCVVGAGLLALGVTISYQTRRGFILPNKYLRPRSPTFTLYRSRAPPRFFAIRHSIDTATLQASLMS